MSNNLKKVYDNLEKSKNDKFDCQIRILKNSLKVLLESDPEEERSSAALGVNFVSHLTLQMKWKGISSFLWEFIIYGNRKKYPSENDFEEYISKNGGNSNAFTSGERKQFLFWYR